MLIIIMENKNLNNSTILKATIFPEIIKDSKENESRKIKINKKYKKESKNKSDKGPTFLSISHENIINLSYFNQIKPKIKIINFKNNPILFKISDFNDEENILVDNKKYNIKNNELKNTKFFSNNDIYII